MNDTDKAIRSIIRKIISDIKVGLGDEFDQNFERQAFFSEKWQRRRSPLRPGGLILVNTSGLRDSIHKDARADSISFSSDHPAAAIHNDGGEIVVTERMKRYFRYRFYQAQGGFERKKEKDAGPRRPLTDGGFYAWTEKMSLNTEAKFWRFMALMKAGSTIKIPRRRFIGASPEVEAICREIVDGNISKYLESIDFKQ